MRPVVPCSPASPSSRKSLFKHCSRGAPTGRSGCATAPCSSGSASIDRAIGRRNTEENGFSIPPQRHMHEAGDESRPSISDLRWRPIADCKSNRRNESVARFKPRMYLLLSLNACDSLSHPRLRRYPHTRGDGRVEPRKLQHAWFIRLPSSFTWLSTQFSPSASLVPPRRRSDTAHRIA
jgi:hypothetical protein